MNTTFFFIALLTARPGQVLESQAGTQSNVASIADQYAEAERQIQVFRSGFLATGSDISLASTRYPNEKLMTLESVEELKSNVNRTSAALEKAQRAHQLAVSAFNEAVARSNQTGAGDSSTQSNSKPAGE